MTREEFTERTDIMPSGALWKMIDNVFNSSTDARTFCRMYRQIAERLPEDIIASAIYAHMQDAKSI